MSSVLGKLSRRGGIADVCLNWEVTQVGMPEESWWGREVVVWLTRALLAGDAGSVSANDSVVDYRYDGSGNVVAVETSSAALNCTSFSPASASPGSIVEIRGGGFGLQLAGNTVRFNGVLPWSRPQRIMALPWLFPRQAQLE